MKEGFDKAEGQGLRFFGKISASISHELKNVLAIINENAGLLQDYALKADKGVPLETERIKTLAEMMRGQIRRGDKIITNMNRFAHSVDETVKAVDLRDILEHVIAYKKRIDHFDPLSRKNSCGFIKGQKRRFAVPAHI